MTKIIVILTTSVRNSKMLSKKRSIWERKHEESFSIIYYEILPTYGGKYFN